MSYRYSMVNFDLSMLSWEFSCGCNGSCITSNIIDSSDRFSNAYNFLFSSLVPKTVSPFFEL